MGVELRPYEERDLEAILALSLRAWAPVFASMRGVLGDALFDRPHRPDWTTAQSEAVRASCTSFATVALNAFHEGMGVVEMIAVDPAYQRRGIAGALMARCAEHMRANGMEIAAVGTGGDPGHAPARGLYEALGYAPLPGVVSCSAVWNRARSCRIVGSRNRAGTIGSQKLKRR